MRRGPGYITKILKRRMRELPDVVQDDLASALGRDRSGIAHQLAGRHHVIADELDVWCDVLDTIEPLEALARRLGYQLMPQEREAAPLTVQRHSWSLFGEVGRFGEVLAAALEDGRLDPAERTLLHRALVEVRRIVDGLLARLPEA